MFVAKLNEVLASKKSFISDPINSRSLVGAGLLNIIHWILLLIKIKPSSTNILLHYNVVYGSDLISKSWYVYWIPLLALILLLLNFFVSSLFYKKEKLASYFLSMATIAVQLIFLSASIILIIAND